jgi:DNA (cytosine-5)-methyltransferase 1
MKPRLLEIGGCEGGSTAGWMRAGWHVTTVDLEANRLKYNPADVKIHKDGLQVLASVARNGKFWAWGPFDAVSLHPPCQWYTRGNAKDRGKATKWERTIPPWREAVEATGLPYVIENVEDAGWDMRDPVTLCGCHFDLKVRDHSCKAKTHEERIKHAITGACNRGRGVEVHLLRPRLFEATWDLKPARPCDHSQHEWVAGAYGGARRDKWEAKYVRKGGYVPPYKATVKALMGVEHDMTWEGLFESVPPAYCEHVGRSLLAHLGIERGAA